MQQELVELMKKKMEEKPEGMDEESKKAKKEVIDELRNLMSSKLGEDLKGVSVQASSPEGLEEGLEMAQKIVGEAENSDNEQSKSESDSVSDSVSASDDESDSQTGMSEEQMKKLLQKYKEKKQKEG